MAANRAASRTPRSARAFERASGRAGDCERAEYWGVGGAGMMFVCPTDGTVLLLLRASWVAQGGTWGIPGGGLSESWVSTPMKPATSVERFWKRAVIEVEEECGSLPPGFSRKQVVDTTVFEDCGFRYMTFIVAIGREQKRLWVLESHDGETEEFQWVSARSLRAGGRIDGRRLHFGVEYTLGHSRVLKLL